MDADEDIKTRITRFAKPVQPAKGKACLVVIHAAKAGDLGQRFLLENSVLTIGRSRENDVVLPSDSVSRRHSMLDKRGEELFVVDLNSTNGTYINDEGRLLQERRLNGGDLVKIGDTIFKYLSGTDVEAQYHEVIFRMAVTDGLTNLSNRKQLDTYLAEEITRAERHGRKLSLLLADIDHFKRINDTYGHVIGDAVLRSFAAVLQKRVRPTDRLGRYGGEEFCAILPDTSATDAARIAEQLRRTVAERTLTADGNEVKVTVSIGAASWQPEWSRDDLYRAADAKLYQAKEQGRNQVCW
ncbi:MAG: GGDEF domain-containing protein [Steroidobacteraceae bacterium]